MVAFAQIRRHAELVAKRRRRPTWDEYARQLGHNLHRARVAKDLSQERLAHLAGISSYTYQKFEKGESRPGAPMNPRLSTLLALCQVLDVRPEDLLPAEMPDTIER